MELFAALLPGTVPPEGCTPVWAACCTGKRLGRWVPPPRGGYRMVLSGSAVQEPGVVARDILRLCLAGGAAGLIADFAPGRSDLTQVAAQLVPLCRSYHLPFTLPEQYAAAGGERVLVNATVAGGSFRERLRQAVSRYGRERVMLDLERTCREYPLPCVQTAGRFLDPAAFGRLRQSCPSYYSPELCGRYFTYRRGSESRYVLFDDRETLRQKLAVAREEGIESALAVYEEVKDLWPLE